MDAKQVLVVANETADRWHLLSAVLRRHSEGPCAFTLLVPAGAPPATLTWTEAGAHEYAQERMEEALDRMRSHGISARGVIGDADPMLAIDDEVMPNRYDEIIISTHSPGISRWLRQDLPNRVARKYRLHLTHVYPDVEALTTQSA
ncbi:MAG TPA: hypothetical protein VGB83_05820 [Actinomycetota bacterium]